MTRRIGVSRFALLRKLGVALLLGVAAHSADVCAAQQEKVASRTIEGIVVDRKGVPQAGAVVLLEDTKSLQVRSYISQAGGEYHFNGLNPEVNYDVRAQLNGVSSATKTVSVFEGRQTVVVNLRLTRQKKQQPHPAKGDTQ